MPIFTIEIGGRATVVLPARDYVSAMSFAADSFLHSELSTLTGVDGAPLWDGKTEWLVRPATDDERAVWEAEVAEAVRVREIDSRDHAVEAIWIAYLVPHL